MVVSTFPSLTTTFLVNRIQGLIERGFDVHILAEHPGMRGVEVDQERRSLLPRVRWASPDRGASRLRMGFCGLSRLATRHPLAALQAWNPLRFRGLAGGRLAAMAAAAVALPRPDAVLGCFGPMGELACSVRALGIFDAPVLTSFHGVDAYGKDMEHLRARYRLLRRQGDVFLPVSRHMAKHLQDVGLPIRRTAVLCTPIRCERFPWHAPRRRPVGQPARLVGLGRLVAKKGFDDGLRVVAELVKRGVALHYEIVGDGVEEPRLRALAAELGIMHQVTFAGQRSHAEVRSALEQSDLLLSTNRVAANGDCEGIPNTIKEAMASGVPVVATRHSGTPELIEDGVCGLLADEGDIAALADACVRMLGDNALAHACAVEARRRVEQMFDERRLNDRLAALLTASAMRWRRRRARCAA
ncbi:MAG: glycosyltransferase [Planctomycetes bacterium]|nr:glycosyltransferase [Planctomycetota bacterium]